MKWWQLLLALLVFLGGAAMVAWGWMREGTDEYLPSFLLEIGAALVLLVPLAIIGALLGRRITSVEDRTGALDERVTEVEDEAARTAVRLDELDDVVARRREETRRESAERAESVRSEVSFENVRELLSNATSRRAISVRGVRVPLDHVTDRVRFQAVGLLPTDVSADLTPAIWIGLEDATGSSVGVDATWAPGTAIEEMWEHLTHEAQAQNRYPGDQILTAGLVVGRVVETVSRAMTARDDPGGGADFEPVIELFADDWVLTDDGLVHLSDPPYPIPAAKLTDDPHIFEHMLEKTWHRDPDTFRETLRTAQAYFARRKRTLEMQRRSRIPGENPW